LRRLRTAYGQRNALAPAIAFHSPRKSETGLAAIFHFFGALTRCNFWTKCPEVTRSLRANLTRSRGGENEETDMPIKKEMSDIT